MLISKWQGTVYIPQLLERRISIGGNLVIQRVFLGADSNAKIFESDVPGYDLIRTELQPPFNEILLRRKGARRIDGGVCALSGVEEEDPSQWPEKIERLRWDSLGSLETFCDTPEKVLESWQNQFKFRMEDEEWQDPGLRLPQIGALHAISAHFAVGQDFDPATVVLPTGTGKTETMLATHVYRRLQKVLVLAPSDVLRTQIATKFITLGILPDAKVVPVEIARPRVSVIRTGIKNAEDANAIVAHSNVIIALPNTLESSVPEAVDIISTVCTDLIVDEAHHVTAVTWNRVRERFKGKRILQFTATPFRRDNKRVDGKIIFNYRLGDAQAAGYYKPINLQAVEEYGDDEAKDRTIATAAVAILKKDLEAGLDHLLMARTSSRERAMQIVEIYKQVGKEFNPVVVFSGQGRKRINAEVLATLVDRAKSSSRIVVCVDMLGEGFDLPNLKIAAIHDAHKSLAITLQFIGRFTRSGAIGEIGEAAAVVNIADPAVESKLSMLYAEGADWDRLIRRFSEERIDSELRLQEVVLGLKETGDLSDHLSLWNLRPAFSAQFFKTRCDSWSPLSYREVLPKRARSWYAFNEDENVLVAVVCRSDEVKWGNYQNVMDTIYDLVVIRWDRELGVLCLYASDYAALRSEQLAMEVTDERTQLISGEPVFRILNNVELPLVKSLGSSRVGAISFTSYFGPNVTEGLADIEKAQSELNNIACLGYENGERVLWGGTQRRGKIWQTRSGTISEWLSWTATTWAKVTSEGGEHSNVVSGFLRPQRMSGPHNSYPISVQWGEQAQAGFADQQFVLFDQLEEPLYVVDLDISAVEDERAIIIKISSERGVSEYVQNISEALPFGYEHRHVAGPRLSFRRGRSEPIALEEYLQRDPFVIRYVDGTYSYNCYHIATNIGGAVFDRNRLEVWDWEQVPLNRESMHKERNMLTIQYRSYENIKDDYEVIFNDDGPGEAADLVCLKDVDESTIKLCLVHCKGAHEGRVSQDIRNFYTVCGQAQKNITARHKGIPRLYIDLKRRHDLWAKEGFSRFLKGDMKQFSYFKEKSRRTKLVFEVILVQPGASANTITEDSLRLLSTTELFLLKTTEASFRIVISP